MQKIAKQILLIGLFGVSLMAQNTEESVYIRECLKCHDGHFPTSLNRMFLSYIKVYSGEDTFKASLKAFLQNPDKEFSVMSEMFLDRFSVKEKSTLSEKELDEAIDTYWDLYNVRNKLK
jgi:vacuolar-type H+-ATPase subunit B/Vma2